MKYALLQLDKIKVHKDNVYITHEYQVKFFRSFVLMTLLNSVE